MIKFIFYALTVTAFSIVMSIVTEIPIKNPNATVVILFLGLLIFVGWGGVLVYEILETVRNQIKNAEKIEELKKQKESYETQLEQYKKETIESSVFEEMQNFEERVIKDITDSKLLATIVEKDSGYAALVRAYNNKLESLLSLIHECDRDIAKTITELKTTQRDRFGYGCFIPKSLHYRRKNESN